MKSVVDLFFYHKRFTFFLTLILLIAGVVSYTIIPKEGAPQIKVPYIFVSVYAEGFAPQDSERMILKPLERELSKIAGVKNITTYSRMNNASVVIEFNAGLDTDIAMNDVREKVDTAKVDFPKETEEPVISEIDLSAQPVLNVVLLSEDINAIMPIARDLKDEIESIANVLKVTISGERVENVEIRVNNGMLRQFSISLDAFYGLKNNNQLISAGIMKSQTGEFSIRVPSLVQDFNEIKLLPVKTTNGLVLKLQDIASIHKTYKDQTTLAKVNGRDAVVLEISKRSGANIIQTIQSIHEKVDGYAKNIGNNVEIIYMRDTSQKIKDSLNNLQNEIILSIIIILLMVASLLSFRQAILIGISVPLSFFLAICVLYIMGVSLNIVVLFGLVLSIGMIVEATSVVVEYASQRINDGVKVSDAYIESVHKMLIPVIVSAVTVLVVSAPLLAFPGVIGGFMKYLPLTLIVVLTSSLFVAIFIIPMIGAVFDKPSPQVLKNNEDKTTEEILSEKNLIGMYARAVYFTLQKPLISLSVLLGLIILIIVAYVFLNKGVEFFPNIETNYIRGFVRGTGNMSLTEKEKVINSVASKVVNEIGNEIDVYYTVAGVQGTEGNGMPKDAIGVIDIQLVDWQIRRKSKDIIKHLRSNIQEDGFIISFDKEKDGPPQSTDIYYEIFGSSLESIEKAVEEMMQYMNKQGMLQNVEDTRSFPRIEYQIIIDKVMAMKYGITAADISGYIKLATNGLLLDKYSPEYLDDKAEIILRYVQDERTLSQILNTFIIKSGTSIPISNFIKIIEKPELVDIVRKNGKLMRVIKANIRESYTKEGVNVNVVKSHEKDRILKDLQKIAFKHSVKLYAGGTDEDQAETMKFLQMAFILAIVVVFLLFLIEFNSFGYALIIISSVFLSIVGVLLGLIISQNPLSIVMCGIGIIALAGIVVSNNLIYLDFFQTFQGRNVSVNDALLKSALMRAKPILLTSGTTVAGLIPAMFGISIDFASGVLTINSPTSQWWIQLSSAIAGGLLFSTVLTLFFTPSNVLLYLRMKGYVKKVISKFSTK